MASSKYITISLTLILAGIATAGQDQPATPAPEAQEGVFKGQPGRDAETVNLVGQRSELTRRIQDVELDLAGIEARRTALQEQIAVLRDEAGKRLDEDAVIQEIQRLLATSEQVLAQVRNAAEAGRASMMDLTRAREGVARIRIDLFRRREELTRMVSGGQLDEFRKELIRLAIDKAEREAQQQVLRRQLEDVQKQLAQVTPLASGTDAQAVNLGGQESELTRKSQVLELDLAGIDARRKALQEQTAMIQENVSRGSSEDAVMQELQRLLTSSEENLAQVKKAAEAGRIPRTDLARAQESVAKARIDLARRREEVARLTGGEQRGEFARELSRLAIDKAQKEAQRQIVRRQLEEVQKQLTQAAPLPPHTDAQAVNLGGQRSELTRRAQALELDLAGIDARRQALQEQIAMIQDEAGKRLSEDVVTQELQGLLVTSEESLAQMRKAAEAGRIPVADLARAQEGVAKARIDLARRREELARLAGGGQLAELTNELSRLAIDKAQNEAQRQIVRRQLEEVQEQLTQALGGKGL